MGSKQRCKNPFWKRRKLRKRQKKRERNHDGTYKRPEVTGGQIIPPALVENQTAEYGPDSSSESTAQDENNNDISGLQGTALPRQKSSSQTAEHGRMRAAVPRQQLSSQTAEHGWMRADCNFRPRIRPISSDAGAGSPIRLNINPDENDSSLVLLPEGKKVGPGVRQSYRKGLLIDLDTQDSSRAQIITQSKLNEMVDWIWCPQCVSEVEITFKGHGYGFFTILKCQNAGCGYMISTDGPKNGRKSVNDLNYDIQKDNLVLKCMTSQYKYGQNKYQYELF